MYLPMSNHRHFTIYFMNITIGLFIHLFILVFCESFPSELKRAIKLLTTLKNASGNYRIRKSSAKSDLV